MANINAFSPPPNLRISRPRSTHCRPRTAWLTNLPSMYLVVPAFLLPSISPSKAIHSTASMGTLLGGTSAHNPVDLWPTSGPLARSPALGWNRNVVM